MFRNGLSKTNITPAVRLLQRYSIILRVAVGMLALALAIPAVAYAQTDASQGDVRTFLRSLVGEWIGTCEQTTDGDAADNKYFHAVVKQIDANTFESRFSYYRLDKITGKPICSGDSTTVSTIGEDGIARSKVAGTGTVLVNNQPKNQEHEFSEVLTCTGLGSMESEGSGTIAVSDMPFNLGKNGKIVNARSAWALNDGVMTVQQSLDAKFRALIFTKTFRIEASYTATRGSDLASLMKKLPVTAELTGAESNRS